jgi:hypothetical protein
MHRPCAYHQYRQGRFGSVLVNLMFTQNLVSRVFCSLNEVKGRFASALDIIERAARCYELMAASSSGSRAEVERSGTSLDASELAPHNRGALCVRHSHHQSASLTAFLAQVGKCALRLKFSAGDKTPSALRATSPRFAAGGKRAVFWTRFGAGPAARKALVDCERV